MFPGCTGDCLVFGGVGGDARADGGNGRVTLLRQALEKVVFIRALRHCGRWPLSRRHELRSSSRRRSKRWTPGFILRRRGRACSDYCRSREVGICVCAERRRRLVIGKNHVLGHHPRRAHRSSRRGRCSRHGHAHHERPEERHTGLQVVKVVIQRPRRGCLQRQSPNGFQRLQIPLPSSNHSPISILKKSPIAQRTINHERKD